MGGSNSFRVSPDHVQALSKDLQSVVDDIQAFLSDKGHQMIMPAQAADPVSQDAAKAFQTNAQAAMIEAGKFRANLQQVVDNLTGAASAYQANDQDGQASLQGRS